MIGIDAVNHFNLVPTLSQLIGKSFYKNSISPKIIGGVESGNHAEAKGLIDHLSVISFEDVLNTSFFISGGERFLISP
jgi:hypothetical protein